MSVFIDLPEETILQILSFLDPQALSRSQQICRKLHTLVVNSPYCIYILTLHSLGYTLPAVPRADLTLAERVELLREHRASWSHIEKIPVERYKLHPEPLATYKYIGGVFAQGLAGGLGEDDDQPTYHMRFHQLPSKNLGVGFKEWAFYDLGASMVDFMIDPDQNLFILLERDRSIEHGRCGYRVHLRTLDTNEPHPRALLPVIGATIDRERILAEASLVAESYHMEVSGALLVILLKSVFRFLTPWIIVWDWRRGVEVTRLNAVNCVVPTLALLSHQALLLPRYHDSRQQALQNPDPFIGNTFGTLDVYTFDPSCDASTTLRMVASFGLPPLDVDHTATQIAVISSPSVGPPQSNERTQPKVYELSPLDRVLQLRVISCINDKYGVYPDFQGMLYVPFHVFLDSVHRVIGDGVQSGHHNTPLDGPALIPWDEWADRTYWLDTHDCVSFLTREGSLYGRRMASPHVCTIDDLDTAVVDFDQRRLRWREFFDPSSRADAIVQPSGDTSTTTIIRGALRGALRNNIFYREAVSAQEAHVRTSFRVGEEMSPSDDVIVDNEHLIVVRAPASKSQQAESLLVYVV